jgi:hypothetical protein
MAFGIEIRTTSGLEPIDNILSAQIVYQKTLTSQSGSDSCPGGVNSSNAVGMCLPLDDKLPLNNVTVSNNTVSWSIGSSFPSSSSYTSNFIIRVYRIY